MKLDLYNQKGEKTGTVEAPKEFFEVEFKSGLIHEALVRQEGNARPGVYAHTKTKGEVRGGGKKPHPQKHTGRARQGTRRSPQMKGGGVTFGPRNERNFKRMMPKKMRRLALFSALSEKARSNDIFVLEKFDTKTPKTKEFLTMVKALPVRRDAVFVVSEKNATFEKSSRNLENVKTLVVNYLNIRDLRKYDNVIFLKDALEKMKEVFTSKSDSKKS
jgi:large subunit ribosomal protein L4